MAIQTVMIIGGSGFLGTQLALSLREKYKVFATYHSRPYSLPGVTYVPLILDNKNWIKRLMYTTKPDVILYALGSNSLAHSEKYPKLSESLHSIGPASLTSIHEIASPRFIFLSSPYVFDGLKGNYGETDPTAPQTRLGKFKLGGENMSKSKFINFLIIRSSPLYGRGTPWNPSYLDYLRMSLTKGKTVEASSQEIHSFAPITHFCDFIHQVIESEARGKIIHYGGLTKLSTFEFAREFAKRFKFDPALVLPKKTLPHMTGTQDELTYDFSVNSSRAVQTLKIKPLLLEQGFDLIEQDLISTL